MTMGLLFILVAIYCVFMALRRFSGQRPPLYIEKDPNITAAQVKVWNRFNGYSMLFWAGFAAFLGCNWLLDIWYFYIPAAVCAVGGILMSLKSSAVLRPSDGNENR